MHLIYFPEQSYITARLILTILCISMLVIGVTKKDVFNIIIIGIYALMLLSSWLHLPITNTLRYVLYPLVLILVLVYSVKKKQLTNSEKYAIRLMATVLFLRFWARTLHLPISNIMGLLLLIPVVWYIIVLFKKKEGFNIELNFMTLLVGEGLIVVALMLKSLIA